MSILQRVDRQTPITEVQVEALITGALRGYGNLFLINEKTFDMPFEGGMFKAAKKVGISTSMELGEIVEKVFGGITLLAQIPSVQARRTQSGFYTENDVQKGMEKLVAEYNSNLELLKNETISKIEEQQKDADELFAEFSEANKALTTSYATRDIDKVAEALAGVADITGWKAFVPVTSVYQAVKAMSKLANSLVFDDHLEEAEPIWEELTIALEKAKVRRQLGISLGGHELVRNASYVEPFQEYSGPLDFRLVARDLIREHANISYH